MVRVGSVTYTKSQVQSALQSDLDFSELVGGVYLTEELMGYGQRRWGLQPYLQLHLTRQTRELIFPVNLDLHHLYGILQPAISHLKIMEIHGWLENL